MIYFTLIFIWLQMTYSLKIRSDVNSSEKSNALRRVLGNIKESNWLPADGEEQPQEIMYELLTKQLQEREKKKNKRYRAPLRSVVTATPFSLGSNAERDPLVEAELKLAESQHGSLLFKKGYVEKRGKNDFLVLAAPVVDPFVTVIPNDIYYNTGPKMCVNWLDECSIEGIRNRLLHRVQSP